MSEAILIGTDVVTLTWTASTPLTCVKATVAALEGSPFATTMSFATWVAAEVELLLLC